VFGETDNEGENGRHQAGSDRSQCYLVYHKLHIGFLSFNPDFRGQSQATTHLNRRKRPINHAEIKPEILIFMLFKSFCNLDYVMCDGLGNFTVLEIGHKNLLCGHVNRESG
jgi:hypothetical protein